MMDTSNLSPADELEEVVHQNGVHKEHSNSGESGDASNDVDPGFTESTEAVAPNGSFENSNQPDSTTADNSSTAANMDGNNVTLSKEEEVKITDQTQQSKAQKGPVKNNNAEVPSSRGVHASLVKRGKDAKDEEASSAVSNGTSARPRQPTKTRSFNDRQNQLSKLTSKSEAASSEVPTEKTKPKSLKKGPLDKVQGEMESSLNTGAEDAKPHKVGTLPNYGFSFRCGERAERRKEFYTKLEEKIHAKEVEKSNLQAKTKENQEAEIKMLRKSLTFKATPMPSFYQEPPPPKVELKKIPTTRAKSPKLGRKKSPMNSESDGNTSSSSQQGRLSLDEKVSESKDATKGIAQVHQKKPQRKSLPPRLASERTSSSNSTAARTSSKVNDHKTLPSTTKNDTSSSNATREDKVEMAAASEENSTLSSERSEALALNVVPSDEPSEAESQVNGDIAIEENPQPALVQETVVAEH